MAMASSCICSTGRSSSVFESPLASPVVREVHRSAIAARAICGSGSRYVFGGWNGIVSGRSRRILSNSLRRKWRVACEVAVQVGDAQSSEENQTQGIGPGSKVKVIVPVKVFHVPKVAEFELEGLEGVVKEVLYIYKGRPISANLPYKVQFVVDINGKSVKFFAHLKDDEFSIVE